MSDFPCLVRSSSAGGEGRYALGDPLVRAGDRPSGCRRIRGIAAQSVFVALGIFSMNVQRIDSFLKKCVIGDDGVIRTKAKEKDRVRRFTESLQAFAPDPPTGDPPSSN